MKPRIISPDIPTRVGFAFDGSIAVEVGDLMFHDSNDAKPASSLAWDTDEATTQGNFAPKFAGVAMDTRTANETDAVEEFPVATDVVVEMDCASSTFEIGDKVTPDANSGGDGLENQKLVKTTAQAAAIGYAVKRYGSATTRVMVRLISSVCQHKNSFDIDTTPTDPVT